MKNDSDILKEIVQTKNELKAKIQILKNEHQLTLKPNLNAPKMRTEQKVLRESIAQGSQPTSTQASQQPTTMLRARFRERCLKLQHSKQFQKIKRLETSLDGLETHYDLFETLYEKNMNPLIYQWIEQNLKNVENEEGRAPFLKAIRLALLDTVDADIFRKRSSRTQQMVDQAKSNRVIQNTLNIAQASVQTKQNSVESKQNSPAPVQDLLKANLLTWRHRPKSRQQTHHDLEGKKAEAQGKNDKNISKKDRKRLNYSYCSSTT